MILDFSGSLKIVYTSRCRELQENDLWLKMRAGQDMRSCLGSVVRLMQSRNKCSSTQSVTGFDKIESSSFNDMALWDSSGRVSKIKNFR